MFWLNTKRIIKEGYVKFLRNGFVSLSSIMVFIVTLSFITSLIFVQAVLFFSLDQIESRVDVTVYFTPNAPEENILEVKSALEKLPEVGFVNYVSADEALSRFKEKHAEDYLTLQALDELGENPLGGFLNIKAKEISDYEGIAEALNPDGAIAKENSSIIYKVDYFQNEAIIKRLNSLIESANNLGIIITAILMIISIIITFNTIRLAIYISRDEIGVMRLVGASNRYIRGPFIVEGVIYGLVSSIITILVFYPITLWLGRNMTPFFGIDLYKYYLSNFFQIFTLVLMAGILLGAISSFLAVRRYLNK